MAPSTERGSIVAWPAGLLRASLHPNSKIKYIYSYPHNPNSLPIPIQKTQPPARRHLPFPVHARTQRDSAHARCGRGLLLPRRSPASPPYTRSPPPRAQAAERHGGHPRPASGSSPPVPPRGRALGASAACSSSAPPAADASSSCFPVARRIPPPLQPASADDGHLLLTATRCCSSTCLLCMDPASFSTDLASSLLILRGSGLLIAHPLRMERSRRP